MLFFEHQLKVVADVKLRTSSDLARLVKNARARRQLTQQDVADAVGITRQSLARLERGNGGTSFDTVLLILDHLGVHLGATTDSRTTPTAAVASDAAQAAANALATRVNPQIEASISPEALASIRESSHRLNERLSIPGSVLADPTRAVQASSPAIEETYLDAAGSAE